MADPERPVAEGVYSPSDDLPEPGPVDGRAREDFESVGTIARSDLPGLRLPRGPVRGHQGVQRELVSQPACPCGDCVRANHGQPAVQFGPTRFSPGYELHGVAARDYWADRDKAWAELDALKIRLAQQTREAE